MLINILLFLLSWYLLGIFCTYILYRFTRHFFGNTEYLENKISFCILMLGSWYTVISFYFGKDFTLKSFLENIKERRSTIWD